MKRIFITLILLSTIVFGSTLTSTQASSHIGENATVCGKVVGAHYARSSNGQPTFINLDRAYPNQKFTIVIWGDDRYQFSSPESSYSGRKVCITGYIDSYRGIPQIVAESPSQIKVK